MKDYEQFVLSPAAALAKVTGKPPTQAAKFLQRSHGHAEGGAAIPAFMDASSQLSAVVYATVRLLRPFKVVETGVARGVTSAAILQAMAENDRGHLYSIDLPGLEPGYREQVGAYIPPGLRNRWTLALGPSAIQLPRILRKTGPIDLFIHDGGHTYQNMRAEYRLASKKLGPDGVLVSDDVCNDALLEFAEENGWDVAIVRQDKPFPWTYLGLARRKSGRQSAAEP